MGIAMQKRVNSTKTFKVTDFDIELDCTLKADCSVLAPVITVIWSETRWQPSDVNYVWIPLFRRFYFVNDIIYQQNRITYALNCDVLGTYQQYLMESTQYVLRSASAGDLDIVDSLYPATAEITSDVKSFTAWELTTLNSGYYVLGVVNDDTSAVGGLSYYVMSNAQFAALRDALLANYDYMGIDDTEISAELQRAIINPFQYIASCKWYPFQPPTGGTIGSISICGWTFNVAAYKLAAGGMWQRTTVVTLPSHPQASRGRWLKLTPYTQYTVFYPPFGVIPIDPAHVRNSNSIVMHCKVDCVSGVGTLEIFSGTAESQDAFVYWSDCMVGVEIQLSQLSVLNGITSTVSSVATGAVGAVTGNIGSMIGGIAETGVKLIGATAAGITNALQGGATGGEVFAGIGSSLLASMGQLSVQGGNGSIAAYQTSGRVGWRFTKVVNSDNEDLGTPCASKKLLSTLRGFTTIQSPDLDNVPATMPELNLIRQYMTSGFFIEPHEEEG